MRTYCGIIDSWGLESFKNKNVKCTVENLPWYFRVRAKSNAHRNARAYEVRMSEAEGVAFEKRMREDGEWKQLGQDLQKHGKFMWVE